MEEGLQVLFLKAADAHPRARLAPPPTQSSHDQVGNTLVHEEADQVRSQEQAGFRAYRACDGECEGFCMNFEILKRHDMHQGMQITAEGLTVSIARCPIAALPLPLHEH